ncbi:MAG: ATP-dependent sacrificial sulfur transferase LarE [Chitinispirillia bacterium]|nr:ATP-dependent sacrificial sulfur transferase LarE [Chitinispirillia bacterium]MCL2267910.1 ATP-dependent sacrificial sulfur transferase LarE [Chitinispirillia bacterium]
MTLEDFFTENRAAVLGFSGGVDSSFVLYAGLLFGADIKACFIKTVFQPEFELLDAFRFVERVGADFAVVDADILCDARVGLNPPDRCYYCKSNIIEALNTYARAVKVPLIIDGTNASDDEAGRPGMRALAELGVRSPLRECGMTKDDVRRISRAAGLMTWNKPAYACLATRVPAGMPLTADVLLRVEKAETALFELGFSNFRVRVIGEKYIRSSEWPIRDYGVSAKLQFSKEQLRTAVDMREEVIMAVKPYFDTVLLDMEGRYE